MKRKPIAALLAAVLCLAPLAGCGGGGANVICLTDDNELKLLKDLDPDTAAIELTDRVVDKELYAEQEDFILSYDGQRVGGSHSNLAWISEDGQYAYFLARVDRESGTLYRAELGKMKAGSEKNDTYIEKVDSNVELGSVRPISGGLYYIKQGDSGRRLYYYNGTEPVKVINGGWRENYWPTDDGKGFLYVSAQEESSDGGDRAPQMNEDYDETPEKQDEENVLYYQPITEEGQREKLATNVSNVYYTDGTILYTKWRGGVYDVYTVSPGEEGVKLVSDAQEVSSPWGKQFYYQTTTTKEIPMKDLVEGLGEEVADAPVGAATDAMRPERTDYQLDPETSSIEDYERASGESFARWREKITSDISDEELKVFFIEEMERQYGPLYDDVAFTEAYDKWDAERERKERESMRRTIQNEKITETIAELYFFDGSESTLVCGQLSGASYLDAATRTAIYRKNLRREVTDKIDFEDIARAGTSDIYDWYRQASTVEREEDLWHYTLGTGQEGELRQEGEWQVEGLLDGGKELILQLDENSELVSLPVTNGALGKAASISEDVLKVEFSEDGKSLYYLKDGDDDGGDILCYQKGESKTLAQDVGAYYSGGYNTIYEDGVVLGLREPGESGGTLLRFENGESARIADDVRFYLRLQGKEVLYVSEGNLYHYDGKEKERLATDVHLLWSPQQQKGLEF